ncbi:hypothetical protein HDU89_002214 [Geranomyces variabilis]|nr:hypothetical protein HDU89_002214 [Geranomyces variabilis]
MTPDDFSATSSISSTTSASHNVSPPAAPAPACSAHYYDYKLCDDRQQYQNQIQKQNQQQQVPPHSHHHHDKPPYASANPLHQQQQQQHCDASNPELADSLVFTASMIIESIWLARPPSNSPPATATATAGAASASASSSTSSSPTPAAAPCAASPSPALAPLTRVIHELLRRSRTSCSTFQLSLLYLIKLRNALLLAQRSSTPSSSTPFSSCDGATSAAPLRCGRRMFLAALILANKYLQDKNYSMKAWAKICGLDAAELCANERLFLRAVGYDLFVQQAQWAKWSSTINRRVELVREVRAQRASKEREEMVKIREVRERMVRGWLQDVSTEANSAQTLPSPSPSLAEQVEGATAAAVNAPHHYGPAATTTLKRSRSALLPPQTSSSTTVPKNLDDLHLTRSASPPVGAKLPPGVIADAWAGLPSPSSSIDTDRMTSTTPRGGMAIALPAPKRRRTALV